MIFVLPTWAGENAFEFRSGNWDEFSHQIQFQKEEDRRDGLSYIISGSLALLGGVVGAGLVADPAERGIYTVFQTIGIASIGYGAYTWQIGGEERSIFQTLEYSKFTPEQKTRFLKAYIYQKRERERQENKVRAVTHALIAGLNLYNASQQKQESLKNALYFVGGVNLLAAISFTFDF